MAQMGCPIFDVGVYKIDGLLSTSLTTIVYNFWHKVDRMCFRYLAQIFLRKYLVTFC